MKLLQVIKMVLWSFFGVRRRAAWEADVKAAHPAQVIGVAIALVLAFIGMLLVLAKVAVDSLM